MSDPVKPQGRRAKPAPAIFANPVVEPHVAAPVAFDVSAPVIPTAATTVDPAAVVAMVDSVAAPAIDVAETAVADAADAVRENTESLSADAQDGVRAAEQFAERNVETVTAHSTDLVSAFAKGPFTMATAFDTTPAQDLMGDLSARTKTAMEKGAKFAEDLTEFTKGNVEAIVTSGRVAAKGIEALAHDAAETARTGFEQAQTAAKSFTQVKSPTELFQLQSDYARTAFDQLVANASKTSEQMMRLMGDIAQPLSNRYALASEKVKSAAF